jgi:hypothetical protein
VILEIIDNGFLDPTPFGTFEPFRVGSCSIGRTNQFCEGKMMEDTAVVCGFEFSVEDAQAIRNNDEAFWILSNFAQQNCVFMEIDDGMHEGVALLIKLEKEGHWKHLQWDGGHFHLFVDLNEFLIPQL